MQVKIDTTGIEITEQGDEMLERPTKAADAPRRDHVELAPGNPLHQRIESGTLISALGSRDAFVAVGGDDVPPEPFGGEPQVTKLILDGLAIGGRYSAVDRNALDHGVMVSQIAEPSSKWSGYLASELGRACNGGRMKSATPKRGSTRIDVRYDAMLVTSDGNEVSVIVKDLSADGFRIDIDEELRVGEQVVLRTRRGSDMPALIVWILGTEAGGRFLTKSEIA